MQCYNLYALLLVIVTWNNNNNNNTTFDLSKFYNLLATLLHLIF